MSSLRSGLQDSFRPVSSLHWPRKTPDQARWILFVIFYAVIANIPYWIASREFGFLDHRGWFCVQFVTVGLLALVVRPILSAVLLFSVMAADLVYAVCESYSLSIQECLSNMDAIHAFSGHRRIAAAAVFLLVLLLAASTLLLRSATVRKSDRRRAAVCLIAFAVLILSTDVLTTWRATGHFPVPMGRRAAHDGTELGMRNVPRFARISIIRLVRQELGDAVVRAYERKGATAPMPVDSASAEALRLVNLAPGNSSRELPNLVIVVVESWGLATDSPLQQALVQPYLQPGVLAGYEVVQGTVPFYGSTIPGEARELCGSSIGFHLLNATANDLKGCLPSRLATLGYHNIALHGMNGNMFRRSTWYKTIGFQETWFNDQFRQQRLPDCPGAFAGTCDANVAAWIGRRLAKDDPHPYFIHWMTLNSHLPVLVPSTLASGAPCSPALSLSPNTALCSWYQLVANVHQSVSELAMSGLGRPTVFVIVGDHTPPFVEPAVRDRFSRSVVPYVLLIPRPNNSSQDRMLARSFAAPPGKPARFSAQTP